MDNRPKRILFIDDEKDVLESIKCVLELKNKFIVDAFSDGESALKATVEKIMTAYDLVLLDIKMPGIDGFELYQRIKEKAPQMKVAFITASEIERKELEEKLPNEKENIEMILIRKPIRISSLIERINSLIRAKDSNINKMSAESNA